MSDPTRIFNARTIFTAPTLSGRLHMHLPADVTDAGMKLLTATLQRFKCVDIMQDTLAAGDVVGLVGSESNKLVSALTLHTMVGRVAVWPCAVIDPTMPGEFVGVVIDHPDTLLYAKDRVRTDTFVADVGLMARMARGQTKVTNLVGRGGCVVCSEKHQVDNENVTDLTKQGLAVCRTHEGWDVRPKEQRWVEERMF